MSSFAAFIISYLDDNPEKRARRLAVHNEQLDQWITNTHLPIFVISMNYQPQDYYQSPRITYINSPPIPANAARKMAFELFYDTNFEWAVMIDNDSWLYSDAHHGSGWKIFDQMNWQIHEFKRLGVFFPLNPQKMPFSQELSKPIYQDYLVFKKALDLKGSMFFVRNFVKAGQTPVYPDPLMGYSDDVLLAFDTIAAGYGVYRCNNIILNEKTANSSSFAEAHTDRKPLMLEGNLEIIKRYPGLELIKESHLLDYRKWINRTFVPPRKVTFRKEPSKHDDLWEW